MNLIKRMFEMLFITLLVGGVYKVTTARITLKVILFMALIVTILELSKK